MNRYTRTILKIILIGITAYAMYKELQVVAVSTLIALLIVFYHRSAV